MWNDFLIGRLAWSSGRLNSTFFVLSFVSSMPAAVGHFFNSFYCQSGSFLAAVRTRIDLLAPESTKAFIKLIFSRFIFFPRKYLNRTNNIGLRCFCLAFLIVGPSSSFFVCLSGGFRRLDSKQASLMTLSKC